jgi:hypothetical protein
VRNGIHAFRRRDLDGPDRIVFDCGGGKLFGQYVQPSNSRIPWSEWADMDPYESFEAFLLASQEDGDFIIGGGDVNARMANAVPMSIQAAIPTATRSTADAELNARGRTLIQTCSDRQLVPLYGLDLIPGAHYSFTYQKGSLRSVNDHLFSSLHALPFVRQLDRANSQWSGYDHAPLHLLLQLPSPVRTGPNVAAQPKPTPVPRQLQYDQLPTDSELDRMLKDLLPVPDSSSPKCSQQSNRQRRRASYARGKSHRGRSWLSEKKRGRARELAEAAATKPAHYWHLHNKYHRHSAEPLPVEISSVRNVFVGRMNPVDPAANGFDTNLHRVHTLLASQIPDVTNPGPGFEWMNELITTEDVDEGKQYLKTKGSNSTPGWDGISQSTIMSIDSEKIRDFANACVVTRGLPAVFILSLLIAILKRGRDRRDPNNYRAVALESCLLKFIMLLILLRFSKACRTANIIPPTQNGFRPHHHTSNNVFILRTAIETSRAQGKQLFVAFVDITNAFPSTDHPLLWLTLQDLNLTGRYFDWIRAVYQKLRYQVALDGQFSEEFQSLCGVLIGDPMSPLLWDLFMSGVL